jgi:hypothetical protein
VPSAWCESGLSGRFWPLHLKPYADELLSSWLVRLSRAYGMEASRFGACVGGYSAFWNCDVDKGLDDHLLQRLIDRTATSPARVIKTTIAGYRGFPIPELYGKGLSAWLLSIGLRGGRRHRAWLQYCPCCLQDDEDPYFRRHWRLAFVTVCPQHECQLLDRCAACAAPCNIQQLRNDADTITRCYACQFDARWAQAPGLERTAGRYRVIQAQRLLIEALSQGQYPLTHAKSVTTEEFLSVLRHLGRLLIAPQHAQGLRRGFCGEMGEPYFEPSFPSSRGRAIEVLSVSDRFALMLLLAWWLNDWSDQFVAICAMAKLSVTDLMSPFLNPPDWYEDAVRQVTDGRFAGMKCASYGTVRPVDSDAVYQSL